MPEESLQNLKDKWSTYEYYRGDLRFCKSLRSLMNISAVGCATIGLCAKILPQAVRQPDETLLAVAGLSAIMISSYFKDNESKSVAMLRRLQDDLDRRLRYCLSLRDQEQFDKYGITIDVRHQPFNPYIDNGISEEDTLLHQPSLVRRVRTAGKYVTEAATFFSQILGS